MILMRSTLRGALATVLTTVLVLAGATAFGAGGAVADTTVPSTYWSQYDAQRVEILINQQRAANHLPALRVNSRLTAAALKHSGQMYVHDMLSHQCPGEASLGGRITAAGYAWRSVGENIGVVSGYSTASIESLEKMMYNETAPNNIHRRLILSTAYRDVGVGVWMESVHHVSWLTIDFGQPA